MEGDGEVLDGFMNVVLGRLKFYLDSFQGVLSSCQDEPPCCQASSNH